MKTLLQPEKLFSLTMWLVAILFAWFLMGFGGLIIRDLPLAEKSLSPNQFASPQLLSLQQTKRNIEIDQGVKSDQRDLLQQSLKAAQSQYNTEHVNFENWLATRAVTQQASQDVELVERTKILEDLKVSQVNNQQKIAKPLIDSMKVRFLNKNGRFLPIDYCLFCHSLRRRYGYLFVIVKANIGRLSGALFSSRCLVSLSNLCLIYPVTVAMCAIPLG
jgi:hypothetical protein